MLHRFRAGALYLVLDVNSGALHRLSPVAWEIMGSYPCEEAAAVARYGPLFGAEAVRAALAEITAAVRRGTLLSAPPAEGPPEQGPPYLRALCLHLSHACNMRCGYCFAGQGSYGGTRALMPRDVALGAVDFLLRHSGPRRHLDVDFFGGEPLLNWEVLKETVEYASARARESGKTVGFTVTTNGLLLDRRIIEFLNEREITVIASLDGRPAVHDRWRRLSDGRGSYDSVLPGILSLVRSRTGNYYVRGTYTRQNLDFAADVRHLAELGIDRVSLEPAVAPPTAPYGLRASDLPAIREQYLDV
ncbi:MAG: radical SAM protein, partial [Firmicutes bacterium]|nr:radical SAM protein [Bacillota bacterium]